MDDNLLLSSAKPEIAVGIDAAVDCHRELVDYGRYAYQLAPWLERFGRERVLPVFLERHQADPGRELRRIFAFLGPSVFSGAYTSSKNLE